MADQTKSIEDLLFDFLIENQPAKFDDDVKVLPHAYFDLDVCAQAGGDDFFLIGDLASASTRSGIDGYKEFNARLTIEIQSRVANEDKTERVPARQRVFEIKQSFIKLIDENQNLGGRVCDVGIEFESRIFDDKKDKWSVQMIGLIFNRRG